MIYISATSKIDDPGLMKILIVYDQSDRDRLLKHYYYIVLMKKPCRILRKFSNILTSSGALSFSAHFDALTLELLKGASNLTRASVSLFSDISVKFVKVIFGKIQGIMRFHSCRY